MWGGGEGDITGHPKKDQKHKTNSPKSPIIFGPPLLLGYGCCKNGIAFAYSHSKNKAPLLHRELGITEWDTPTFIFGYRLKMSISSSFALFMGGGFQQNHLIIVSHARKDFGFLSSSSVVKASQLGRKMGIYLFTEWKDTPPTFPKKVPVRRWPVWRRVGSVWDIAPSAIPLRFQPRSLHPLSGEGGEGGCMW